MAFVKIHEMQRRYVVDPVVTLYQHRDKKQCGKLRASSSCRDHLHTCGAISIDAEFDAETETIRLVSGSEHRLSSRAIVLNSLGTFLIRRGWPVGQYRAELKEDGVYFLKSDFIEREGLA